MLKKIIQDKVLFPEILWSLPQNIHKRARGSVLVIAGSFGMAGAGVLASDAAFRIGAGLVTLAHPDSLSDVYKKMMPETMTIPLPSTKSGSIAYSAAPQLLEHSSAYDVVAIGPGMSLNTDTIKFIREVLHTLKKPKVIDASALSVLEESLDLIDKWSILTPHAGEMSKIIKGVRKHKIDAFKKFHDASSVDLNKSKVAEEFADYYPETILVLQGDKTVIANGAKQSILENRSGNPGMSKAGVGDVLTGIIAGLVAQNLDKPFSATATAVYLHSLAGDIASQKIGERSIVASDVLKYLPEAIRDAEKY